MAPSQQFVSTVELPPQDQLHSMIKISDAVKTVEEQSCDDLLYMYAQVP